MKNVNEQVLMRHQGVVSTEGIITWTRLKSVFGLGEPKRDWKCPIVTPRF
ncbi:hypothetical protein G5B30_12190 [Sphingobacterium sp. SGG-5]|nr:hypothetical protein [Sphingobacterium sp. SGG-5]NGM62675.1 hypothetical protein [Sphingobacterium sp. SGG-5]